MSTNHIRTHRHETFKETRRSIRRRAERALLGRDIRKPRVYEDDDLGYKREKGDDDGVEYNDPRDYRDERRRGD